jgi:DNA-binding response OmpR family regulator
MSQKRILVVDDEAAILDILKEMFTLSGYDVVTAASAETALEILRSEQIMVMFLDLKLPEMSGIDLCKEIRKKNKVAIIHALTGHVNNFGADECRSAGFDDYFIKPVQMKSLVDAAENAFNKLKRWKP